MKKVMVCGCGAQGSTIIRKLDEEPNIVEIVCADYNFEAAKAVASRIKKGTPKQVDATKVEEIVKAAEGCELIVNVMPLEIGGYVLEAAMQAKCCYQDLSACKMELPGVSYYDEWFQGIVHQRTVFSPRFEANNTTAVIGTGSAPGVMCVMARRAVQELDECETIMTFVYEGGRCRNRFLPFWWSKDVALGDMEDDAYAFENCKQIRTKGFGRPVERNWEEVGRPAVLVEHSHDEPVYFGMNREKYFKGVKNAYFKYGGTGIEFAYQLKKANLISREDETFKGATFNPHQWVLSHIPNAPKDPDEIQAILDEGIIEDNGAFVVEAYGKKDGKDVMVDLHVSAPSCADAFARSQMTGEMYLTGQGAFLFTKLFVNDMMPEKGLLSSDMLNDEQVAQYLKWAEELDITYTIDIKEGVKWSPEMAGEDDVECWPIMMMEHKKK